MGLCCSKEILQSVFCFHSPLVLSAKHFFFSFLFFFFFSLCCIISADCLIHKECKFPASAYNALENLFTRASKNALALRRKKNQANKQQSKNEICFYIVLSYKKCSKPKQQMYHEISQHAAPTVFPQRSQLRVESQAEPNAKILLLLCVRWSWKLVPLKSGHL